MTNSTVFTLVAFLLPLSVSCIERKSYIVYFGHHNGEQTHEEIEEHHRSYLYLLNHSEEEANDFLLYSYKNSINGFAAMLTPEEAFKLSEMDEVTSVFPSEAHNLHTIRSWEFLGVRKPEKRNFNSRNDLLGKNDLLVKARYGKEIIVGLLDSGIWPESKSFNDEGMDPIPKKWKGICQHGDAFNSSHCNKKIIGARYYSRGFERSEIPINSTLTYKSARDFVGHGTHTSSTVGGRNVHAKYEGYAQGMASGGAPLVRLAMYKVCWPVIWDLIKCHAEDILAAFDDAIGDGVDILSISLGIADDSYSSSSVAIGSLHAVKHNIVVSCSAGNDGNQLGRVLNTAPWVITVAGSSIDRAFVSPLSLGNGIEIPGESMTRYRLEEKMYPLVYAGQIEDANVTKNYSGQCLSGSLSPRKTKGKIVLCLREDPPRADITEIAEVVKMAGGVGLILNNNSLSEEARGASSYVLPDTAVRSVNIQKILEYINSTQNPLAYIKPVKMALNVKPAPYMASFSSRGPSSISPDFLKPDITAPGIYILAAVPEEVSTPSTKISPTSEKFSFYSGTSMSSPHVSAVAALLKAIHPTWSSAAIRSAIMTTAKQTNNMGMPITEDVGNKADPFTYGAGHIHPTTASDPGLVYDASYTDYLLFLCNIYGKSFDKSYTCPQDPPSPNTLNYPSLAISKLNGTVTIERTVTNVGDSGTTYVSQVEAPPGVYVKILPTELVFKHSGEKKRFTISVKSKKSETKKNNDDHKDAYNYVFGWYSWSDGVHVVRSPMAINLV